MEREKNREGNKLSQNERKKKYTHFVSLTTQQDVQSIDLVLFWHVLHKIPEPRSMFSKEYKFIQ